MGLEEKLEERIKAKHGTRANLLESFARSGVGLYTSVGSELGDVSVCYLSVIVEPASHPAKSRKIRPATKRAVFWSQSIHQSIGRKLGMARCVCKCSTGRCLHQLFGSQRCPISSRRCREYAALVPELALAGQKAYSSLFMLTMSLGYKQAHDSCQVFASHYARMHSKQHSKHRRSQVRSAIRTSELTFNLLKKLRCRFN